MRKGEKMSEMDSLKREIRERLNASKDDGSIDPLAAVTDLADRYSIPERFRRLDVLASEVVPSPKIPTS
jgi:hypothetical protein